MTSTEKGDELRRLLARFDAACVQCLQGATALCASRSHYEVNPDHLLLRLVDDTSGDVGRIFETFKVDAAQIRRALQRVLENLATGHQKRPALSERLIEIFQSATVMADQMGCDKVRPGLLLLAFVLNPDHTGIAEHTSEMERIDTDQLRDHFFEIVGGERAAADDGESPSGAGMPGDGSALEKYTIDLTAKASNAEIDPVFGRDQEIRKMIDIFARRRKNNPILVGEPGTGKTAIVEGLALRIVKGDVPPTLKGVKLISLDMGLLQAGASVKGEFENRLKNVIKEIKASETPIITFIDEAHTLIGAGGAAGGSDAANLLKPALARGELRTCAATTWAEYKKYFEKDAALERRFQLVRCDEPGIDDAVVMLRGLKDKYEEHHKVLVLDEAVSAAVNLSKRYISGRFLPDKAVDLLDTAAARVGTGLNTPPARLEDIDRELGYLDTAIRAMRRDEQSGVATDGASLEELLHKREQLLDDRERMNERWEQELAAVKQVIEARTKLIEAQRDQDADSDSPADHSHATSPEISEMRKSVDAAMAALRTLQGEDALLHPQVDGAAVAAVVSDWTGIPVGSMVKDEIESTLNMEDRLRVRVCGQDHALTTIAQKLRTAKAGIGNPDQPMGVFLCVGPSGVGKTELAMSIADLLFGGDQFLTTINMSEFMEKHTVSQLKGSPPGYVGYGEGGVLTEAVRQHPYSVVLLDEIEKAHPDVMNLFYQVFDKGNLADGEGRVIDFKNTVIVMTSNLGTDVIQQMCESGDEFEIDDLKEAIYPHLREHLKPALVARMTVIPFFTLDDATLQMIARIKLGKLGRRVTAAHKMAFQVDDGVYPAIASRCNQVDIGARQVDHLIDAAITPELSRRLLEQMAGDAMPASVTMTVADDGEFAYEFSN